MVTASRQLRSNAMPVNKVLELLHCFADNSLLTFVWRDAVGAEDAAGVANDRRFFENPARRQKVCVAPVIV